MLLTSFIICSTFTRMQYARGILHYDIAIVGAGPAGCACALALKDAGLKVALIDKAAFPRDKVCGDAIPGRAIKTLRHIDPAFEAAFKSFPQKYATRSTSLFYKGRAITFDWVREAYTCTRMQFDNFLYSLAKDKTSTEIYTNTQPHSVSRTGDGFVLEAGTATLRCKLLIGADGAQSQLAKQLAGKKLDRKHHVGSVRAYYSNIGGINNNTTEIYFEKQFLPSYLWVFPLPNGMANVGFGMLSSEIAHRKVNIKNLFYEFIEQTPALKSKFKNATQASPLEGFGLPLGSDIGTISGDHFMLTGDAASLIDPISGDGIGNAMASGRFAALQAIECFTHNNFTASFMQEYDSALLAAIGKELKTHYRAQRILSATPSLLDAIFLACRSTTLKKLIQKGL